jgi:2-oxoglutarate ferredoxin oxidoreductase subunit delta
MSVVVISLECCKIIINPDYCKGCYLCVACCPKKVLQPSNNINAKGYSIPEAVDPEACIQCKMCEIVCPDLAIAVKNKEKMKEAKNGI